MIFQKLITTNFISFLMLTTILGCNAFNNDDSNNDDLLLGLALLNQGSSAVDGSLKFDATFDSKSIKCGTTTYTMPGGQVVQMRDFRFFVQDVQFVRSNGSKVPMQMKQVDNWQLKEGNDQVALLDFTNVGSGKCSGTSDDDLTRKEISGTIFNETFESVEVTLGVPTKWNHVDPSQQPSTSPIKTATGLTWSWLAGYKFIRLELEGEGDSAANKRLLLHLGSTNCTGDTSIPQGQTGAVSCANSYRPTLVLKPDGGFNPTRDTITINVDEFFKGNGGVPTSAFNPAVPTPLSCMPIGNGGGTGGTPATCGPILRNLGLVPGSTAGFTNALNQEIGVGTVNTSTQQPILKVIR